MTDINDLGNKEIFAKNLLANYFNIQKSDLIENKNKKSFDELDILFDKYKDVLTEHDKEHIKFIIEQRQKEIDKELGEE